MNVLALLLALALGVVCLGVPVTAVVVVYRDELLPVWDRVLRALAFDPRHPDLDYHFGR